MCPTQATLAWLAIADISQGPLFRALDRHGHLGAERLSDRAVALVVKRAAQAAGLDPARYAGESLRQGGLAAQRGGEGDVDWRLPPRAA
jgi:hypothetical protein